MASVDSRIVTMKFDNAQFERGVSTTMNTLSRLKSALSFSGATKGLDAVSSTLSKFGLKNPFATSQKGVTDLQAAANKFSLNSMTGSVTGVSKSFIAMSTVAITAISNLTNSAITAGARLAKSLTIDPVMSGLREYETNLNSIQTILANTGLKGAEGLARVNDALAELNEYSDKTIYNFSEMARNIGTFTAAGVDLNTATGAIKGIANLAAVSGSNSQQASTAMYQLSQALAAGKVSLMDWNSVVNAGMGGKVFQKSLMETARVHGVAVDDIVKDAGSFRGSLEKGWITGEILTETLSKFTGDLNAQQLKSMGYNKQQIAGIMEMGRTATDAATKVKTVSQLIGTLQEAAGSGWAKSFQLIFGNFDQAKELFTGVNNVLGGMIQRSADSRNKILGDWNKLGGRTVLIDAIANAFNALLGILKPIKEAFRDIFPAMTGQRLFELTTRLRDFTEGLKISEQTSEGLRRTFRGVFAIFSIIGQVIGAAVGMFVDLFGVVGQGSGSFLDFTGGIGDFLVALDDAIRQGGLLTGFFQGLGAVLAAPIRILGTLGGLISGLFTGLDAGGMESVGAAFEGASKRMEPLAAAGERIRSVFTALGDFMSGVADKIGEALSGVGEAIASSFTADTFGTALDAINTGLFAGILLLLKNFMSGGLTVDFGGGMFDSVKQTLGSVTTTLEDMQTQIKSDTLLKIAAAVAILAASIFLLSTIDPKKLATGLGGMAAGFIGLQVSLTALSTAVGYIGTLKLPILTASLIALAGAMLLFSLAVKTMASIEFGSLIKGLLGIGTMLFILTKAVVPLSANSAGMVRAGVGLIAVAVALKILASAVQDFADMDWAEMGQGLIGVATALGILAGAMMIMPKNIFITAAGLVVLGVGLNIIARAVSSFASIGWDGMVKGITGLAVALGIIAAAMAIMPPNMLVQAAALVIVGAALNIIGMAVAQMGGLSMEEIAKGLGTLAGALIILSAALYAMIGSLPGAAALVVAAGALTVLVPVLLALGAMSWEAIAKGLIALAGAFTVIGVAGFLLAPLVPALIGLGAALILLGAGLALAGAGALAFASAFAVVVAAGSAGVIVLSGILSTIIRSIPQALASFGRGIVAFASAIAKGGPAFFRAFSAILTSMLNAVIQTVPKMGQAFTVLLRTALRIVVSFIPAIVNAGLTLMVRFLAAINRNVPKIVPIAVSIVTRFINGIANNLGRVIQAGVNLAIKFINGVSAALNNNSARLGAAGANLALAIVRGMASGIASGAGTIASAAVGVAQNALSSAKSALGINSPSKEFFKVGMESDNGMALGLSTYSRVVDKSAAGVAKSALSTLKTTMSGVSEAVSGEVDMNPVISPVLDLTRVRQEASSLGNVFSGQSLSTEVSRKRASSISADRMAAALAAATAATEKEAEMKEIKFEQNNYSPKALPATEIYRNTRTQLSLAREALS